MTSPPIPIAVQALAIVASNSESLDLSALLQLSLTNRALDTAASSNPFWTRAFAAKFPWTLEIAETAASVTDGNALASREWTRGELARTAMRVACCEHNVHSLGTAHKRQGKLSEDLIAELKEEIDTIDMRFAEVLEEVRALEHGVDMDEDDDEDEVRMEGLSSANASDMEIDNAAPLEEAANNNNGTLKSNGTSSTNEGSKAKDTLSASVISIKSKPKHANRVPNQKASSVSDEEEMNGHRSGAISSDEELAEAAERLSVSSGHSRDSISTLEPAEHLVHILGALPTHLPTIHLIAFLLLLNGENEACVKVAEIGLSLGGEQNFVELKEEATSRISGQGASAGTPAETELSSAFSDPNNPPTLLNPRLLTALLNVFRHFDGDSDNILIPAEFSTVVQKTNGKMVPLKDVKAMIAALEGGVDEELKKWTAEWVSKQPLPEPESTTTATNGKVPAPRIAPPPPRSTIASSKQGLSLAGWFLFFSRQVHTEDGEEETRADLMKLGWTGEL